jgi:hypothetical protein
MPKIMKRSPTAYNFLTKDKELRTRLISENPEWKQTDVMSEYSRLWNSWDATDKQKYVDLAREAKEAFTPPPSDEETSDDSTPTHQEVIMRPKKARTSFFCYLHNAEVRNKTKEENPDLKVTELTTLISTQWKAFSDEDKQPWKDISDKEKVDLLENPQMVEKKVNKKKNKKKSQEDQETTSHNSSKELEKVYMDLLEKQQRFYMDQLEKKQKFYMDLLDERIASALAHIAPKLEERPRQIET